MAVAHGPRMLSLKQPWAWAVSIGRKKVENRSWSTKYRGPVYIHSSTKTSREGVEWLRERMRLRVPEQMTHGAIIAAADLVDVVTHPGRFGSWFFGPYGFVLENIRPLERPVPTKGKPGLARVPAPIVRRVEAELRRR
jgi:hypothetical protein